MAQTLNRLSARSVTTIKQPGLHADGGGLYLRVDAKGAKRWVFVFRRGAKRTEMGLGSVTSFDLADVRELAKTARARVAKGEDPIAGLKRDREAAAEPVAPQTFGDIALAQLAVVNAGSRGKKNQERWKRALTVHAAALTAKPIDTITTEDVLKVVRPLWPREVGSRLRGAIEYVLDAARVQGLREGENPARWRGHLEHLLPKTKKLSRGHHPAMPYAEMPAFYQRLAAKTAPSAKLLQFQILTLVRPTEAREAPWREMRKGLALWVIPPERMKEGREHRVPLTSPAKAILEELGPGDPTAYVFPGEKPGKPMSLNSANRMLDIMGVGQYTAHGFRSAFSDWAAEQTDYSLDLIEMCLAHKVGSEVSRAYRRGDALDKRREIMEAWASYLAG